LKRFKAFDHSGTSYGANSRQLIRTFEPIGAGGMGTVYRGIDSQTLQPVAVKQLKAEASSPEMIARFKRSVN